MQKGIADLPANQSPTFEDINLFSTDVPLQAALHAAGVDAEREDLAAFGAAWGAREAMELGRLANENPPRLKTLDPRGERIDRVEFHPAYHELMRRSVAAGIHCS